MSTAAKKQGRRRVPFVCPWNGHTINGLYQAKGSNQWRITEGPLAGTMFRENDPHEAVRRFLEMTSGKVQTIPVPFTPKGEPKVRPGGGTFDPPGAKPPAPEADPTVMPRITLDDEGNVVFSREVERKGFFMAMRKLILEEPLLCARETGIEWLAWHDHKRPEKAASLTDIGETYFKHAKISPNELSRSKLFWAEFEKVAKGMAITTVDGINHEMAHAYEAKIEGDDLSPKSRLHRFRKVRGILHFNIKRGKGIEHCRKALDTLAMLEVKDAHPLDPTPISPADFWAIHGEAEKAGDDCFAALMLMALNAALYSGEVAAVRWDEIDLEKGGFVSRRSKTGVSRVGMLWPEVIKAIKPLPRMREQVFCTKIRSFTTFSVADRFERYRDAAGIDKSVTFSWIRDAAYSIAMQATTFDKAELLAGHRLPGTADSYLRRNPQLVAPACEAIRTAFYAAKPKSKAKSK